jgi:FAD/FMN-containing dehydrogenase
LGGVAAHAARRAAIVARLAAQANRGIAETGSLRLRKRSASNLFRYSPRTEAERRLDLGDFRHVLGVDVSARLLDVEGLATFESIVDHTLPYDVAPFVTPELKHITVGGACVGIGIESNSFRYGFVHDTLVDADVLLPDGRVIHCAPHGQHADLFHALPNSYGTLGYVLRATLRLMQTLPYVHLRTTEFRDAAAFLAGMRRATEHPHVDFIEGLVYAPDRYFLTLSRYVHEAPRVDDIMRGPMLYKQLSRSGDVYLRARDYLFRYDPDWFWNFPHGGGWELIRRVAPPAMRHSAFYKRLVAVRSRFLRGDDDGMEPLIQDWEVPWDRAESLLRFALDAVDLDGKPWMTTPILTARSPTLYPVFPDTLYLNLGCYCRVRRRFGAPRNHYTRILDRRCFELGGIKMLYSSTFIEEEEFWRIYNGEEYRRLKASYDPAGLLPTLYDKCVRGR